MDIGMGQRDVPIFIRKLERKKMKWKMNRWAKIKAIIVSSGVVLPLTFLMRRKSRWPDPNRSRCKTNR